MKKSRIAILLEYIPVVAILPIFKLIPYSFGLRLSKYLGLCLYYVLGNYRKIILANLDIAFANAITKVEARSIAMDAFVNMIQTFFELIALPGLSADQIRSACLEPIGYEQYKAALSRKHGVIVASIHFSNWYWPLYCAAYEGYKIHVVTRPLDNPLLDRRMNRIFAQAGIGVIPRSRVMPDAVAALRRGETVALMIDQNAAVEARHVEFFGILAATNRGLPILKRGTGAEVVCVHDLRIGLRHQAIMARLDDFPIHEYDSLLAVNRYFEPIIRAHKGLYFWLHPRWKSRPANEESFYKNLKV